MAKKTTIAGGSKAANLHLRPAERLMAPKGEAALLATIAHSISGSGAADPALAGVSDASNHEDQIPLSEDFRIIRRMTETSRDETLQLSKRPLAPGTTEFVIDILFQAHDLEDAMKRAAQTYNLVHGGYYNQVRRRRGCLVYTIDDRKFPYAFDPDSAAAYAVMEGLLMFLHAMLTLTAGVALAPYLRCVRSRRPVREPPDGFLAFWEAPVRCGAPAYALEYDLAIASLPINRRRDRPVNAAAIYDAIDAMIAAREQIVPKNDLRTRVIESIKEGAREQSDVAKRVGVSVATLRRRLSESGANFRDLKSLTLNETALSMLHQRRPVAVVAEALNYVDTRSFSRAFKAWNGVTPAAYVTGLKHNQ